MCGVRLIGDVREDLRPVGGPHLPLDLSGRAAEGRLAAGRQEQHLVAHGQIGQRVGDHEDHTPGVGEPAEGGHHLAVECGVETGGRFVEDEQ